MTGGNCFGSPTSTKRRLQKSGPRHAGCSTCDASSTTHTSNVRLENTAPVTPRHVVATMDCEKAQQKNLISSVCYRFFLPEVCEVIRHPANFNPCAVTAWSAVQFLFAFLQPTVLMQNEMSRRSVPHIHSHHPRFTMTWAYLAFIELFQLSDGGEVTSERLCRVATNVRMDPVEAAKTHEVCALLSCAKTKQNLFH